MVAGGPAGRTKIAAGILIGLAFVLLGAGDGTARADGALPSSLGILVPADRPDQILLATTFGVLISEDRGASWLWTCEQPTTAMGYLYGVGPSPRDRIFALSPSQGLAYSDDGTCTWQRSGGALSTALATDYFVDPTNASRVVAIAAASDAAGNVSPQSVYASSDSGTTFGAAPLYTAPASTNVVGIEIARSDPQVVYVAMYGYNPGRHPVLVRSADGGATWTAASIEPLIGASEFRILAVDPADANLVYVRVIAPSREEVWVTRDGGGSFERAIVVDNGSLRAFARLASGTVLVATLANLPSGATSGGGYRSTDQGRTFSPWTLCPQPHIEGLAERAGVLYLAGKNYSDSWALATSTDEGRTITPLSTYDQVRGVKACAASSCASSCSYEVTTAVWASAVCSGELIDGGVFPAGPPAPECTGDGSTGGTGASRGSGCGCDVREGSDSRGPAVVILALCFAAATRRRRPVADLRLRGRR